MYRLLEEVYRAWYVKMSGASDVIKVKGPLKPKKEILTILSKKALSKKDSLTPLPPPAILNHEALS